MVYPISEGSFLLISTILVKTDGCQEESDSCPYENITLFRPVNRTNGDLNRRGLTTHLSWFDYTSFVV